MLGRAASDAGLILAVLPLSNVQGQATRAGLRVRGYVLSNSGLAWTVCFLDRNC